MNMMVKKEVNGALVTARPVFKGGSAPAYWAAIVNGRMMLRTFASPQSLFRFVAERTAA